MRTHLVLITATLILLAGCIGTTATPDQQAQPADQQDSPDTSQQSQDLPRTNDGAIQVEYTQTGFQPQTITIEQNQTVTWQADDSATAMDVAVDRHPSHTQWDGTSRSEHCTDGPTETVFDSCGPQQEYSFTFTKTGTFTYHNHAAAYHTGTIIVE